MSTLDHAHDYCDRSALGGVPITVDDDADLYCFCRDGRGRRHVHCPWGGMHIHYVGDDGNETAASIPKRQEGLTDEA